MSSRTLQWILASRFCARVSTFFTSSSGVLFVERDLTEPFSSLTEDSAFRITVQTSFVAKISYQEGACLLMAKRQAREGV